jgi:polysaccharide deacetylase 2 family uncharacterized protein YibQ
LSWVLWLTWCLTLLIGGAFGVLSQGLSRANRTERGGGLAAAPYRSQEEGTKAREKRAAIVIDDLGPDLEAAASFCRLEMPITLAVLPYQRYSRQVVLEAARCGKEVILHMPMEPRGYPAVNPGAGSLLLEMDRETLQAEVAQQLDALPGCVGVSNHMGSLFTEEEEPMRWVLSVLAERNLFFLDSLTTPHSAAWRAAVSVGVTVAQRTHFLDEDRNEDAIVRRLCGLVDSAVRQGAAIGIAHAYAETLAALPKVAAAFEAKGVRLVPVSQLLDFGALSAVREARAGSGRGSRRSLP